jgi:hypothetical protein
MPVRDQATIDRMRAMRKEMHRWNPDAIEVDSRTGLPVQIDPQTWDVVDVASSSVQRGAPVVTPAAPQTPVTSPVPSEASHGQIDPEKFGAAVGRLVKETIRPLRERIAELDEQTAGMQKKLDALARTKYLAFKGAHQPVLDYEPGSIVTDNGKVLVATKSIAAGTSLRDGSGWVRMV